MITSCNEKKSDEPLTITSLERIPKEPTFQEDSKKGINETDMNAKEEKDMKKEPISEKPERLLVTAKEAPAYNREVLFIIIHQVMVILTSSQASKLR